MNSSSSAEKNDQIFNQKYTRSLLMVTKSHLVEMRLAQGHLTRYSEYMYICLMYTFDPIEI